VVAGSLGSEQVYAYDVLGAVVNQAARVEGITKEVGVPILVTEDVARGVPPGQILARRVARFLPVGVQTEVDLYTLEFAPADPAVLAAVTQRHALHAQALAAFEQGQWEQAFDLLHPIVKEDPAARYVYTLALQGKPPRDWRGVIQMTSK
jgi:adenylate cyclase